MLKLPQGELNFKEAPSTARTYTASVRHFPNDQESQLDSASGKCDKQKMIMASINTFLLSDKASFSNLGL